MNKFKNRINKIYNIIFGEKFYKKINFNWDNFPKGYELINKVLEVNYVKGFAMIMKKSEVIKNLFDENIFLYLEEIDLCKRFKKKMAV